MYGASPMSANSKAILIAGASIQPTKSKFSKFFVFSESSFNFAPVPQNVKQIITDKFKEHTDSRIQNMLNYMNGEQLDVEQYMPEFVRQTKFSDEYRGESFAKTFPELYVHIEEYFNE